MFGQYATNRYLLSMVHVSAASLDNSLISSQFIKKIIEYDVHFCNNPLSGYYRLGDNQYKNCIVGDVRFGYKPR